jgi:hypothetical protein
VRVWGASSVPAPGQSDAIYRAEWHPIQAVNVHGTEINQRFSNEEGWTGRSDAASSQVPPALRRAPVVAPGP